MLRTLFSATILAGALAGTAMAQAPDAGCALPSEPTPRTGALVERLLSLVPILTESSRALFLPLIFLGTASG
jgi:hypothetical protein